MAGNAGASSSRWYKPMPGFAPHPPAFKHRWGAKLLGATMWFWIFYRAKQDGPVLLVSRLTRLSAQQKSVWNASRRTQKQARKQHRCSSLATVFMQISLLDSPYRAIWTGSMLTRTTMGATNVADALPPLLRTRILFTAPRLTDIRSFAPAGMTGLETPLGRPRPPPRRPRRQPPLKPRSSPTSIQSPRFLLLSRPHVCVGIAL